MTRACGGAVWHQKHKSQGIIPKGLTGLDKEATWSYSKADGWIYGHGSFTIVSHRIPILGLFQWMPNSAHEAKRLETEIVAFETLVKVVCMDSKADDEKLYSRLKQDYSIKLLTVMRKKMNKSEARQKMLREQNQPWMRQIYQKRSVTVEPMQGLVKELFELQTCWMRGDESNRWLFAAMGIAVQVAQRNAYLRGASTWNIKEEVLGL